MPKVLTIDSSNSAALLWNVQWKDCIVNDERYSDPSVVVDGTHIKKKKLEMHVAVISTIFLCSSWGLVSLALNHRFKGILRSKRSIS